MAFKKYTHIERLDSVDCEGLLDNETVYVSVKADGTNSSVWLEGGEIKCGSRNRVLTVGKDNAGFCSWMMSDNEEANLIKNFVLNHENLIVFGEWMGLDKFVGHIKDYNQEMKGHLWIFDMYDKDKDCYLPEEEWRALADAYNLTDYCIPLIGVFDYPSYEDILTLAENNKWMLDNAPHAGEGVVCKVPNWYNKYGHMCYGKLVLDEFKQSKAKPQKTPVEGEVEQRIVDFYLTATELSKNIAKTCLFFGNDEFDNKNNKMMGYFINICFVESILEEIKDICKRFKNPAINFGLVKGLATKKAREYAGYW